MYAVERPDPGVVAYVPHPMGNKPLRYWIKGPGGKLIWPQFQSGWDRDRAEEICDMLNAAFNAGYQHCLTQEGWY